jgi:hypothetical protein
VSVATLYLHIDKIETVGGSWTLEIEDLGGYLGGFGIANKDICMCRGVNCGSELWFTPLVSEVSHRVLESFLVLFRPFVRR